MKKHFLWMFTAILTLCGAMMNTSCSDNNDNPASNPLAQQVKGLWWALADSEGTYNGGDRTVVYTRMGLALNFEEDGSGYVVAFFFDTEDGDPDAVIGGETAAPFTYSSRADGTLHLDFSKSVSEEYADYFKAWTTTYQNGTVSATDGKLTLSLEPASDAMAAKIREWDHEAHTGASAEYFNINDEDFTAQNWRDQEAIYIYDGKGTDVTDSKGRTGYTLVNLPWYEGDKLVNMSPDFCDDLTPEQGWEWVFNRCGSRNTVNNNFFAVYNKYTGILRFFYYQPESFQAGNDHVWEVSMSDHLASSSVWPYGVPKDRTIVDKAAIGQTANSTMRQYVSPWVTARSLDGFVTPNAGWWAFDVDLSSTRTDRLNSSDNIRLQMRSWNSQQASFVSTMAASIDGSLAADLKLEENNRTVNSSKGFVADMKELVDLGKKFYSVYSSIGEEKWGDAISNGIEFGKKFLTLSGIDIPKEKTVKEWKGDITGTISLGLTGSVNTQGIIQSSQPVVGVVSPTFYLKDFDTQNSHLGQGTWNLKTSPVVYITNQIMSAWDGSLDNYPWGDEAWTIYSITYPIQQNEYEGAPQFGCVYFFDPTTVQVELNPELFPEDQIEWIEVDALPGARAANKVTGTDGMRKALGLADRNMGLKIEDYRKYEYAYWRDYWFYTFVADEDKKADIMTDYFYGENQNFGLNYGTCGPLEKIGSAYHSYYGRGDDAYILEPQMASPEFWNSCIIPPVEINVTVAVKLKNMQNPIVYNRIFLPEVKYLNGNWEVGKETSSDVYKLYDRIQNNLISPLQKDHHAIYDYNVKRVKDKVMHYLNLDKTTE